MIENSRPGPLPSIWDKLNKGYVTDFLIIGAEMLNRRNECASMKCKTKKTFNPYHTFELSDIKDHLSEDAAHGLRQNTGFMKQAKKWVFGLNLNFQTESVGVCSAELLNRNHF